MGLRQRNYMKRRPHDEWDAAYQKYCAEEQAARTARYDRLIAWLFGAVIAVVLLITTLALALAQ